MAGDLFITGDRAADSLLNRDGTALLIGMLLDQQVPMEWAFTGPATLRARLGHLDPVRIAGMSEDDIVAVSCATPAIHRFPAVMGRRIHRLCDELVATYGGEAERVWQGAADGADLLARLRALPGFGDEKARIFVALLAKRFGVRPDGWEQAAGAFADDRPRTIADIHDAGSLAAVREWKRAQKAAGKDKQDRPLQPTDPDPGRQPTEIGSGTAGGRTADFRGLETARVCVDEEAQAMFVALSGDANPLHVDPIAARRLPFGRRAVHGMHLTLLALDHLMAQTGVVPGRVRAVFRLPVGVGDDVELEIDTTASGSARVRVVVDGRAAAEVTVDALDRAGSRAAGPRARSLPPLLPAPGPADRSIDELAERSGTIALAGDARSIANAFPQVAAVGSTATAELLAVTRLVGMEVPGLHSMLSSFDLALADTTRRSPLELVYRVEAVDERFSKVVLGVDGPSVHGAVTAFVRPAPSDQLVGTAGVDPAEFGGGRALVIGGSRGLGAAAVQLLAAGGAEVRFTYHRGADDATRVAGVSPGSTAHPLDVTDPDGLATILRDGWQPTLLAWFASPPIFVGGRDRYSPDLFDRFRTVYVDAFLRTVAVLGPERLDAILWPSSEAVTVGVAGLAEYADAKRVGEQACAELAAAHAGLAVHTPRFPRLRTDQTASFVPVDADDPAPHVLAALRRCIGHAPG